MRVPKPSTIRTLVVIGVLAAVVAGGLGVAKWMSGGGRDAERSDPTFSGSAAPHLRRLTEAQYRQAISDIFGSDIKLSGRFEPDMRVDGLLAVGTGKLSVTPSGLEQYETIGLGIAKQVVDIAHRDKLVGCSPAPSDPEGSACAEKFFRRVGERLYRRPLAADELKLAVDNAVDAGKQLGNFYDGLAASLSGFLTAPEFLFQVEVPVPGGTQLDRWSMASRLSFFLWNTTPDDELLDAASRGDLQSASGRRRVVDRMIASPRFENGVRAFLVDFLHLDDLDTVTKDPVIYPAFSASVVRDAREQTLRTLIDELIVHKGDYRDVFTSHTLAMNRNLGALYRVPVPSHDWMKYDFPADDPRGGLLTQISFLALNAHPGRSSPTLRGKAIREVVMCTKVPPPPANVNFAIVQDTKNPNFKTVRERLTAHRTEPTCAGCHKIMDPQGLALENFDGAGQYRVDENGATIDAAGTLDGVEISGARGLGKALHDNPLVPACLVQSAYRYGVGRDLEKDESPVLARISREFATDGYQVPNLMRIIATSSAFYQLPPQPAGVRTAELIPERRVQP